MLNTLHPTARLRLANDDHRQRILTAQRRRLARLLRRSRAPGEHVHREEVALAA